MVAMRAGCMRACYPWRAPVGMAMFANPPSAEGRSGRPHHRALPGALPYPVVFAFQIRKIWALMGATAEELLEFARVSGIAATLFELGALPAEQRAALETLVAAAHARGETITNRA